MRALIIGIVSLFLLSSCAKDSVQVRPSAPVLIAPKPVKPLNAKVYKRCLWLNNHNTNLCGEDLEIILTQIKKLRTNEKTCAKIIKGYNDYANSISK